MSYSYSIANAVHRFLEEDDWKFSYDSDKGRFTFGLNLQCKIKKVDYHVLIHDDCYTVYAVSPLSVEASDTSAMTNMAEFLSRANYGLRNGNFEFDFRDGEVRYKCFVNCDGLIPSEEVVKDSIYIPASMFKRYSDGIVSMIFGMSDPKTAIERCEKN